MTEQPPEQNRRDPRDEKILLFLFQSFSFLSLCIEAIMPLLGWMLLWAAGFLTLAWFHLLPSLPPWLHGVFLGAYGLFGLWLLWQQLQRLSMPAWSQAARRLERDSRLRHRPLISLTDRPSAPMGPAETALWEEHQRRAQTALQQLSPGVPRLIPALGAWPLAPRVALGCFFLISLGWSWSELHNRFLQALTPGLQTHHAQLPPEVNLWVSPPDYTRIAPIFLTNTEDVASQTDSAGPRDETVAVGTGGTDLRQLQLSDDVFQQRATALSLPEKSLLSVRVTGGQGQPLLHIGAETLNFALEGPQSWTLNQALLNQNLSDGTLLKVTQGEALLGRWLFALKKDHKPLIAFDNDPLQTERSALAIGYVIKDDYGVTAAGATLSLDTASLDPEILDLILPGVPSFPQKPVETRQSRFCTGLAVYKGLAARPKIFCGLSKITNHMLCLKQPCLFGKIGLKSLRGRL